MGNPLSVLFSHVIMWPSLITYPKGTLMTTEEILQLLLVEMKEMRGDIKEMRGDIKELRSDVNRLETNVDNIQSTQDNMRLGIKNLRAIVDEFRAETNQRFNRLEGEFKGYRRSTQGAISDIQLRQENIEEDVKQLKDRLDKAS